jgi:hypothetical protein
MGKPDIASTLQREFSLPAPLILNHLVPQRGHDQLTAKITSPRVVAPDTVTR